MGLLGLLAKLVDQGKILMLATRGFQVWQAPSWFVCSYCMQLIQRFLFACDQWGEGPALAPVAGCLLWFCMHLITCRFNQSSTCPAKGVEEKRTRITSGLRKQDTAGLLRGPINPDGGITKSLLFYHATHRLHSRIHEDMDATIDLWILANWWNLDGFGNIASDDTTYSRNHQI